MIGESISHYRIIGKIGSGGMGEVYRAEDSNLHRHVAIKVLPDESAYDAERLARFQREAEVLASLNHPNIATVHGLEESGGKRFIVMELVEGQTLAQRLLKGPLPVTDALEVCRQIAEGLEAAHEKGVIHRDLKPANVMITADDKVKILDFGLAKALVAESAAVATQSPTITEAMTRAGTILGTAAYMSPEQAKGKSVDKRADIWAFGCILYECLTGEKAFHGETVTETVAAILKGEPDWGALSEDTPGKLVEVMRRCLTKDLKHRLHDIADVRIELQSIDLKVSETPAPRGWKWVAVGSWIFLLLVLVTTLVLMTLSRSLPELAQSRRLSMALPLEAPLSSPAAISPIGADKPMLALSPDGMHLAYVAQIGDQTQIWACDLTRGTFKALPGSAGGHSPFFSPDGAWIGFFDRASLKALAVAGGQPVSLAEVTNPCGGCWGTDGFVYFNRSDQEGLFRVPAKGGPVEVVIKEQCLMPECLGAQDGLLASKLPNLCWIEDGQIRKKICTGFAARYLRSGHLVYARTGKLMAVQFDRTRCEISGEPITLADDLRTAPYGTAQFAVSQDGTIVYVSGRDQQIASFVWVDRQGNKEPLGLPEAAYGAFSLSQDGTRLAVGLRSETEGGRGEIWIYDVKTGDRLRLSPRSASGHPVSHLYPRWTTDGRHVIYWQQSEAQGQLVAIAADRSSDTVVLWRYGSDGPLWLYPMSFSPDGSTLAAFGPTANSSDELYFMHIKAADGSFAKAPKPEIFPGTPFTEAFGQFSPDGHAIAYTSHASGQSEIWVTTYPGPGPRFQVSRNGGMDPSWSPDGREIFYQWESAMFAVGVNSVIDGRFGSPRMLFSGAYGDRPGFGHDMTADGKKFLMLETKGFLSPSTTLRLITNVAGELQRRIKK